MTAYAAGRYQATGSMGSGSVLCRDRNLGRDVYIHWVAPTAGREAVRARLAALQSVRSPYVALIYDLVEEAGSVGVVEEHLDDVVAPSSDLHRLYEFCAGVAALHDNGLAHGALGSRSFRMGPLGHGRLCNLAFGEGQLSDPSQDCMTFLASLQTLGADQVQDPEFQRLRSETRLPFSARPFRDRLAAFLLRDRHRALAYWRGASIELSAARRRARFAHPVAGIASVTIEYDGIRFCLAEASGEVRVNNVAISHGHELPGSCVIALGGSQRPWYERYFITFDQSHPEVA